MLCYYAMLHKIKVRELSIFPEEGIGDTNKLILSTADNIFIQQSFFIPLFKFLNNHVFHVIS